MGSQWVGALLLHLNSSDSQALQVQALSEKWPPADSLHLHINPASLDSSDIMFCHFGAALLGI